MPRMKDDTNDRIARTKRSSARYQIIVIAKPIRHRVQRRLTFKYLKERVKQSFSSAVYRRSG